MRRRRPGRKGQALVEFALALPLFLLVVLGLFDLGRAVYYNSTISNAAREAVRLGIVDQNVTAIEQEAVDTAGLVMSIAAGDVAVRFLGPGLQETGHVCNSSPGVGCVVEVTVTHAFAPATPFIQPINLSAVTRQPIENPCVSPAARCVGS